MVAPEKLGVIVVVTEPIRIVSEPAPVMPPMFVFMLTNPLLVEVWPAAVWETVNWYDANVAPALAEAVTPAPPETETSRCANAPGEVVPVWGLRVKDSPGSKARAAEESAETRSRTTGINCLTTDEAMPTTPELVSVTPPIVN